jgi:hypothetical protein
VMGARASIRAAPRSMHDPPASAEEAVFVLPFHPLADRCAP